MHTYRQHKQTHVFSEEANGLSPQPINNISFSLDDLKFFERKLTIIDGCHIKNRLRINNLEKIAINADF